MATYQEWQVSVSAAMEVETVRAASQLVHTLQAERGLSNGYLNGKAETLPEPLRQARAATDQAIAAFSAVAKHPAAQQEAQAVSALLARRGEIEQRRRPAPEVFTDYSNRIDGLFTLLANLGNQVGDLTFYHRRSAYWRYPVKKNLLVVSVGLSMAYWLPAVLPPQR